MMLALRIHPTDDPETAAPEGTPAGQAAVADPPRLIDISAVAVRLGVSRATAERLHAAKKLPTPVRLGKRCVRWDGEDLEAWLACRKADGVTLTAAEWERHRRHRSR